MKTTDITRKELANLKRTNTIELKELREWMKDIEEVESRNGKYLHGDPIFLQRLWCERDIDTCEFRIVKYARMTNEIESSFKSCK